MKNRKKSIPEYDSFVSRSFEFLSIAKAFLKRCLPTYILVTIDWNTFKRADRTYTDERLKKRYQDTLFTVEMKKIGTLLIHIEHQSSPEILMPVRLLHYAADSLEPYLKKNKELPLLIQIVLYHGARAPYPYQTTLQDYYNHRAWGSQELSLRFYLVDLTQGSDAALLKHGHCALLELLLKHGRDGKFELPVAAYRKVFQECVATVGDPYVSAMLHYAVSLKDQEVGKQVYSFIEEVLTDKKEIIMTYGEQLRQEGKQEGLQQGLQQGMQQEKLGIARTMLKTGESIEKIARWTGLSEMNIRSL